MSAKRARGEGTIVKRAPDKTHPYVRWEARLTLPDGSRKSFYARTQAEARLRLTEALRAIQPSMKSTQKARWKEILANLAARFPAEPSQSEKRGGMTPRQLMTQRTYLSVKETSFVLHNLSNAAIEWLIGLGDLEARWFSRRELMISVASVTRWLDEISSCAEATSARENERAFQKAKTAYDMMLVAQEGKCAICKTPSTKLAIDHDHQNGMVRGLLCPNCNHGLGMFGDEPDRLLAAIEYIQAATSRGDALPYAFMVAARRRLAREIPA